MLLYDIKRNELCTTGIMRETEKRTLDILGGTISHAKLFSKKVNDVFTM
jgi:hypothetical protein